MDYPEWSHALADYTITGTPAGTPIYLSVDEDVLENVGQRSGRVAVTGNWTQDFLLAVREACVCGDMVWLPGIRGRTQEGSPLCTGFLGAMVLAASRMVADEESEHVVAGHNYFTRLREVLGLPTQTRGRPSGLAEGDEEPLWDLWKRWLIECNLLPTAEPGSGGPATYYVHYPLSQVLLRAGDLQRLEEIFRDEVRTERLPRFCDANRMAAWFRNRTFGTRHLSDLKKDDDPRRFDAVVGALLEFFNSISWNATSSLRSGEQRLIQQRLPAGFYRREDAITGVVDYLLYPPQPRRGAASLSVERENRSWPLRLERPGWCQPLWAEPLVGGGHYPLAGDVRWKELVVPQTGFWIFVRDPDDLTSSVLATWQSPGAGETFLLVCQERYAQQLAQLRDDKLLQWDGDPEPLDGINKGWQEYHQCMILSPEWDEVLTDCHDLCEALRPRVAAGISLSGGLRTPHRWAWLEGGAPEIRVLAFEDSVHLRVTNIADTAVPCFDQEVNARHPVRCLSAMATGHYLIEVFIREKVVARRSLEIAGWNELQTAPDPAMPLATQVGAHSIRGALVVA